MQFNSWEFLWFCLAMLGLYWLLYKKTAVQNLLLLAGSYYFYSRLHISFPVYLLSLTLTGYVFGRLIDKTSHKRKALLVLGIVALSSCLVILKYTNFGINTLNALGQISVC